MPDTLFSPGTVVITRTLQLACEKSSINEQDLVISTLAKHVSGDWGSCCSADSKVNNDALKTGNRLMSVYNLSDDKKTKFWVITEWDRSVTTFLLPEDY